MWMMGHRMSAIIVAAAPRPQTNPSIHRLTADRAVLKQKVELFDSKLFFACLRSSLPYVATCMM
jgi:hypothetical protein